MYYISDNLYVLYLYIPEYGIIEDNAVPAPATWAASVHNASDCAIDVINLGSQNAAFRVPLVAGCCTWKVMLFLISGLTCLNASLAFAQKCAITET